MTTHMSPQPARGNKVYWPREFVMRRRQKMLASTAVSGYPAHDERGQLQGSITLMYTGTRNGLPATAISILGDTSTRFDFDAGTVDDTSPVFQHYIEKDIQS